MSILRHAVEQGRNGRAKPIDKSYVRNGERCDWVRWAVNDWSTACVGFGFGGHDIFLLADHENIFLGECYLLQGKGVY